MCTEDSNNTNSRKTEGDLGHPVLCSGLAGSSPEGDLAALLERREGLRTGSASHAAPVLVGVRGARRLAGRLVCELDGRSPHEIEDLEEAIAQLRSARR